MDLALNNLQRLICKKRKTTNLFYEICIIFLSEFSPFCFFYLLPKELDDTINIFLRVFVLYIPCVSVRKNSLFIPTITPKLKSLFWLIKAIGLVNTASVRFTFIYWWFYQVNYFRCSVYFFHSFFLCRKCLYSFEKVIFPFFCS